MDQMLSDSASLGSNPSPPASEKAGISAFSPLGHIGHLRTGGGHRTHKSRHNESDGWVYFIESHEQGAVKIGFATDVRARLKKLQTGNPHRLEILEVMRGSREIERGLHDKFRHLRIGNEWFRQDEAFLIFLENLETLREHVVMGMSLVGKWRDEEAIMEAMENMVFDQNELLGLPTTDDAKCRLESSGASV